MPIMKNELTPEKIINNWPSQFDGHLHYCIGLSGGIDSIVLLHLFHQISQLKPLRLSAIHVNHGISPYADDWSIFCQQICHQLNIPLECRYVKVNKIAGQGLENSARKLRYQEYAATNAEVLILAHHADDQIETMLSQIMRGTNLHNSAGMLAISNKFDKYFWRPLLNYSKSQLQNYANAYQLSHINDESNADNSYLRNFIRNKIMPELAAYDPQINPKLLQSVTQLQNSVALADDIANSDYHNIYTIKNQLDRHKFIALSQLRQENLLAFYIRQHLGQIPSHKQLQEFIRQSQQVKNGRHPQLKIGNHATLIADYRHIYIVEHQTT